MTQEENASQSSEEPLTGPIHLTLTGKLARAYLRGESIEIRKDGDQILASSAVVTLRSGCISESQGFNPGAVVGSPSVRTVEGNEPAQAGESRGKKKKKKIDTSGKKFIDHNTGVIARFTRLSTFDFNPDSSFETVLEKARRELQEHGLKG